jgi:hypothetical protein
MATVTRGELILHFVPEEAEEIKARVAKQVAEAAAKAEAEKSAKAEAEKSAKAEAPPMGWPAPVFAAGNPGAGADAEKKPAQEPKGEPANREEPPEEGGEKAE